MKLFFSLGALASGNMLLWFVFQWYLLTTLGPGIATDAFFAGFALPQFISIIAFNTLTHVLVPFLAGEEKQRANADAFAMLLLVSAFFAVLAIVAGGSVQFWLPLLFPGFSAEALLLTADVARIQLIGMVFIAANAVLAATLQARKQFVWVELSPLFGTVVGIVLLVTLLGRYGVVAAAWASTIRFFLQMLILLPVIQWRDAFSNCRWQSVLAIWQRLKPLLLGAIYYKSDVLVDRFLASMASAGSLSLFYFAQQCYGAANTIVSKALAAPLTPRMAEAHKGGRVSEFQKILVKGSLTVLCLTMAGLVVFAAIGQWLLGMLVGHGGVTPDNVSTLYQLFIGMAGMFVGGCVGQVLNSAFYARGNTKIPALVMSACFTLGVAIKIFAFKIAGLMGLAFATTFYYLSYPTVLAVLLKLRVANSKKVGFVEGGVK
ncbi:MAG: lipid II flippase MurJ [Chitinivorax sp.]